jgi:urea carboxylase-associated protein 1
MAKPPALKLKGRVLEDCVVAAGQPWGRVLEKGERLCLVDLEGRQAVDFLCYNADNPAERYNAADTMKIGGKLWLGKGSKIYSDMGNVLFTVVDDTVGFHDTVGGCCSAESNRVRYGVWPTPNCRDNFLVILSKFGLGKKDIVANINFFMYVPVGRRGEFAIKEGKSKPGDRVEIEARMRVLAVLSNCPQKYNPASGGNPTPIRVVVWRPRR